MSHDLTFQVRQKAAFDYSRRIIIEHSKSFTMASRLLPRDRREAVYAMYGFCRYADDLIDKPRRRTTDEIVDELEALAEELRIAYRTGDSEHPVIAAFIEVACHFRIPLEYPMDFLKGIIMDASHNRYRTFDDLYLFCYRVAGIVGLMMTHVLGYETRDAFPYAEKLGVAMQLTNILRDVQEDKDMGRIYIPQDELAIFEVPEEDILNETMSDRLHRLMAYQAQRAHDFFDEANRGIPLLHRESRFGIRCASRIYRGILHGLEANDYDPFRGRVWISRRKKMRIIFSEYLKQQRNGYHSK